LALTPGTRLGVDKVTEQIREGGMGQAYRATDTKLKRQVANKALQPSLAADYDRLARFQRAASPAAGPPTSRHGHHEQWNRGDIHDTGLYISDARLVSKASAEKWDTTGIREIRRAN
jgi:serine/threonine protein kinase